VREGVRRGRVEVRGQGRSTERWSQERWRGDGWENGAQRWGGGGRGWGGGGGRRVRVKRRRGKRERSGEERGKGRDRKKIERRRGKGCIIGEGWRVVKVREVDSSIPCLNGGGELRMRALRTNLPLRETKGKKIDDSGGTT